MQTAADRLRAALVGRLILPTTFVEVKADDIVEVCRQVPGTEDNERFEAILQGSAAAPGLDVNVPATNVEWLLQKLPAAEAQADPHPRTADQSSQQPVVEAAEAATDIETDD
jgi:hypothetical protein